MRFVRYGLPLVLLLVGVAFLIIQPNSTGLEGFCAGAGAALALLLAQRAVPRGRERGPRPRPRGGGAGVLRRARPLARRGAAHAPEAARARPVARARGCRAVPTAARRSRPSTSPASAAARRPRITRAPPAGAGGRALAERAAVLALVVLAVVAGADRLPPVAVVAVPVDGALEALGEAHLRGSQPSPRTFSEPSE